MRNVFAIRVLFLLACTGLAADAKVRAGITANCGQLVRYVRQVYPKEAKRLHIQGVVKLRVRIGVKGEPVDISVLQGNPTLVPAALGAVKRWRYARCLLNGQAVEVITEIDVPFILTQ